MKDIAERTSMALCNLFNLLKKQHCPREYAHQLFHLFLFHFPALKLAKMLSKIMVNGLWAKVKGVTHSSVDCNSDADPSAPWKSGLLEDSFTAELLGDTPNFVREENKFLFL